MPADIHRQTTKATEVLRAIVFANRQGECVGITSICSANPYVLQACMRRAKQQAGLLLIEATSNQVNQLGGYTGQTSADFCRFVRETASANGLAAERILLGGDHLGPHPWRKEASAHAMEKARTLVRSYVLAGFQKIHLDASMHCADDPGDRYRPLADEIVSQRAAELCAVAERAFGELPHGSAPPLYVIGTEVPIPGGETQGSVAPTVTRTDDLERTIRLAKEAFYARGLQSAWERVIALVVQPGVEFGDATVFPYHPEKAASLSQFGISHWHGIFEAHSTDYQSPAALRNLVADHFAILKVGPRLTFAFREAVFALACVEEEWIGRRRGIELSGIREAIDHAMLENPVYWKDYYHGDDAALSFARKYSYSDRIRYYWGQPNVTASLERLLRNLTVHPAPFSLLSQYFPAECQRIPSGALRADPLEMILARIEQVLEIYAAACGNGRIFVKER